MTNYFTSAKVKQRRQRAKAVVRGEQELLRSGWDRSMAGYFQVTTDIREDTVTCTRTGFQTLTCPDGSLITRKLTDEETESYYQEREKKAALNR